MNNQIFSIFLIIISYISFSFTENQFESDTVTTSSGELKMTFIAHGTLLFEYNDLIIHIDPVSRYADYSKMPKADIILITHHHGDHLDVTAIDHIKKQNTDIICTKTCFDKIEIGTVMKNGESENVRGIKIEAVPAYNIIHKRENGELFHPKGIGNGYVLTFADRKVYIAGDTENVPELKNLSGIDYAFLPMNVPYTMTPQMVADAVGMFKPKVLYPYHFGNTNVNELLELLKDNKDCEVRIRKMQ